MNSVKNSLDKLSTKDVQSMLMFVLFKLREIPEVAPLSQLVYLLDENSLIKLLKYFGGQTITFPTIEDLRILIHTLTLYKSVDIDHDDFDSKLAEVPSEILTPVTDLYNEVKDLMEEYVFVN